MFCGIAVQLPVMSPIPATVTDVFVVYFTHSRQKKSRDCATKQATAGSCCHVTSNSLFTDCPFSQSSVISAGDVVKWTINNNNNNKAQHSWKARQEGTAENNNIRRWTVLWNVRLSQYRTLTMGNNITCGTKCNYRTAATLCTVGTWFGSVVSL